METKSEDIRNDLRKTAKSMADKLFLVEERIHTAVDDTKTKVENVVKKVSHTAEILSPKRQYENRPWLFAAVLTTGGFLAGRAIAHRFRPLNGPMSLGNSNHGLGSTLASHIRPHLLSLAGTTALAFLRRSMQHSHPSEPRAISPTPETRLS